MSKRTAKVLKAARDIIVERGWCQGRYSDEKGRVCSFGAIERVTVGDYGDHFYAKQALNDACDGSAVMFNDTKGTTKAKVLAMFSKAIRSEAHKP